MPPFPPPHCPTCSCDEDYDPFALPGPPMPKPLALPEKLYIYEETWDHWQGSPAEVGRLARRADDWMNSKFTSFQHLPKDRWYTHTGEVAQQAFVSQNTLVAIPGSATGTTANGLANEVGARRSAVRSVWVQSNATWRSQGVDPFGQVPLVPLAEAETPHTGSSEVCVPPQRIEIHFETTIPAVRLRVIAAGPQWCAALRREMQPHVDAGRRKHRVWSRHLAGRLGVACGALIGLAVGLTASPPGGMYLGLLAAYALGTFGDWFIGWAFPPLELTEDWEKSRWTQAQIYGWQLVLSWQRSRRSSSP